jgi:hypothetical protein
MSDLEGDMAAQARLGRQQGAQGRPPANARDPDTNELNITTQVYKAFQLQKEPIIRHLSEIGKSLDSVAQQLVELEAAASNVPDTSHIQQETQDALSQKRTLFVRDIKREILANSSLLRFKGDRGIEREAHYDTTPLGLFQWMVIIFAVELCLNSYFYSFNVGLVGGAIFAGVLSLVTAIVGFFTGSFFRLHADSNALTKYAGWCAIVFGLLGVFYLSSVTATYRSISVADREQQIRSAANFDQAPATQVFEQAVTTAPQIFLFPVTLRLPFRDLQSFLLFIVSLITFFVAFWKGYTSQDPIWGYKEVDESHKKAEAAVHALESELVRIAQKSARTYIVQRDSIVQAFTTLSKKLGASEADVKRLQTQLQTVATLLAREFALLVRAYRNGVAEVHPTELPKYFATEPSIDLDISAPLFQEQLERLPQLRESLGVLMNTHLDRLRREINDATNQERLSNAMVASFKTECEIEAKRQIQEETKISGALSSPAK